MQQHKWITLARWYLRNTAPEDLKPTTNVIDFKYATQMLEGQLVSNTAKIHLLIKGIQLNKMYVRDNV